MPARTPGVSSSAGASRAPATRGGAGSKSWRAVRCPGTRWLSFACQAMWRGWRHLLGADVAYGRIYVRDRFRCMSLVCSRKDVTPHHLRFRSAGGSDEDDNVAAVYTWCHLFGVHGGRMRAA